MDLNYEQWRLSEGKNQNFKNETRCTLNDSKYKEESR